MSATPNKKILSRKFLSMQTTGDRADFPSGAAMIGRSTADSSGINGPFTVCDALMRERDALIYHRQMLEQKRTELEQSLQKQRSENEVCPALFVFPSAEDLSRATQSDCFHRTSSTHGIAHQCVHNSAVLSSCSTPICSGVGAAGLREYQKSFHAQYLPRTLRLVKEIHLRSANQDAVMHALTTVRLVHMLRRLELEVPVLTEPMVRYISQLETEGQFEFVSICIHGVTPTLNILCSLSRLKEVNLSFILITDEEVRQLRECHTLVKIDLRSCTALTNVDPLSSIATLEVVNLSHCASLTHVGVLGRLPALREIYLSRTLITDDEIRQLGQSHTLVKIDINFCEALTNVDRLSSIATLEVINLSFCTSLTRVGALGKLPVLREVDLSSTRITDEDVRLLSESNTLVKIDLHWCKSLKNVNPLSSIATLEVINLSHCDSLTHVGVLGKLPTLKEVDLSFTSITDEDVRLLSESNTLVKIDLNSCTALTNVDPLSSIATLEVINLSHCDSLTHVGVLGRLPALKKVDFSKTSMTDDDVRLLSESHTLLKMDLDSCTALTNVDPLSSIATLEVINLSGCTSLIHVGVLGKLPALREVNLWGTRITDVGVRLLTSLRKELGFPSIYIKR